MKKTKKIFIASVIVAVFVLGAAASPASAQTVSSVNCNSVILQGDVTVSPSGTPTNVWFEWGNSYSFGNTTSQQMFNYSTNFSQPLSGLSENTTYYYRARANNSYTGDMYGSTFTFTTPSCGTTQQQNYTWPYYQGYTGYYGTGYYNQPSYNYGYDYGASSVDVQTSAVTNFATSIGENDARLNGLVSLSNGSIYSNGYFEWGTTASLGNTTTSRGLGNTSAMAFNETINGLYPNTTYYYRAVVSNSNGVFKGEIRSFKTLGGYQQPASSVVVKPSTTVVSNGGISSSKPSLISLVITTDNEQIKRGDHITFTTTYKNTSSLDLKNVVLRIELPAELAYQDASRGIFSEEDNTVTVEIGALSRGESGVVVIKADVEQNLTPDKTLVVLAKMVYTVPSGTQEEVVAYVIENPEYISGQAALSLFGGGFFPSTLIEWLALIVFIFILILLSRSLYGAYAEKKKEQDLAKK